MNEPSSSAAPAIVRSRFLRCLLAALLNAALLVAGVSVFGVALGMNLAVLFVTILAVGFCSAQVHERMVRLGGSDEPVR